MFLFTLMLSPTNSPFAFFQSDPHAVIPIKLAFLSLHCSISKYTLTPGRSPPLGGALSPRGSIKNNINELTLLPVLTFLLCFFVFSWIVGFCGLLATFLLRYSWVYFLLLVYADEFSFWLGFVLCSKPNFLY